MAEDEGSAGFIDPTAEDAGAAPQVQMIAQYVKDFSFENPNAPAVYQWQSQPQINIGFNIGSAVVADGVHEVNVKIEVHATGDDKTAFRVELMYAGLFAIRNVPAEQIQPFLYAEAPRLLFPFARRVVADAVRDGNFPPLVLDPIDFGALYMQQAAQAQGGSGIEIGQA
jgi:preprotein translocase subunit SecB